MRRPAPSYERNSEVSPFVKASIYYAIALTGSIAMALFVTPILGPFTVALVMFTPLIAVLVMKLVVTRDGYSRSGWSDLGFGRLGLRQWPIALGLPLVVLLFAYGTVWTFGIAQFNVPAGGLGSPIDMAINIAVTMLFCFGEEIGWRGYLLPKLMGLGHRKALLLSGLMQAIWHLPFIIFTGLYHGEGNTWIIVPLFLSTMTIAGILFGYLRIVSKSTWPAVIAHAVFNVYWTAFGAFSIATSPLAFEYLAGESGLLTLAAVAVSAWILIRRMENPRSGIVISTDAPRLGIA
jgi:membrane protease YdiL (CAAX protease family)